MKSLIRDYLIGMAVMLAMLTVISWWNAPEYKGCARLQGQVLCYTLEK